MGKKIAILFLLSLAASHALMAASEGMCFRFYDQWKITDQNKRDLRQKYGIVCILFDPQGTVIMKGLSPQAKARFINLYNQCMRDGCMFCDAAEGSCEDGTCGANNSACKPYMENDRPSCGEECGYYALQQL